jgi:hypothetical protein
MMAQEDVQMQPEAPHKIDMEAWAWCARGAELYPPGHRLEAWRRHGRNPTAIFWRRKRILATVGIHAGIHDDEESLVYLFEYPLEGQEDMPMMEIWGLECQAEALRAYREMTAELNPEERLGWIRMISIRRQDEGWREL